MRTTRRPLLALLLLTIVPLAHSQAGKSGKSPKSSAAAKSNLSTFFAELSSKGNDEYVRPYLAPFLSVPAKAPMKEFVAANPRKSPNGKTEKACSLVMKSEDGAEPTPMCAVITDGTFGSASIDGFYFKVGLDGSLLAAFKTNSKVSDGKPVRGSGVKEDLDINSPEVKDRFQKELDFWLSGKFRKYWKPKSAKK